MFSLINNLIIEKPSLRKIIQMTIDQLVALPSANCNFENTLFKEKSVDNLIILWWISKCLWWTISVLINFQVTRRPTTGKLLKGDASYYLLEPIYRRKALSQCNQVSNNLTTPKSLKDYKWISSSTIWLVSNALTS